MVGIGVFCDDLTGSHGLWNGRPTVLVRKEERWMRPQGALLAATSTMIIPPNKKKVLRAGRLHKGGLMREDEAIL